MPTAILSKQKQLFSLGSLGLILLISLDFYLGRPLFLADDLPILSAKWLTKSFVLFFSLCLIFYPLNSILIDKKTIEPKSFNKYELIVIFVFLFISSFFVFLFITKIKFITKTNVFHRMSYEDGPVEFASALFLFFSSVTFLFLWIKCFFVKVVSKITHFSFIILSFVLFIVCMEEISWFQRLADIETPVYFEKKNSQKEMNFHNLFTHLSEYLYYFGSFVFFVLLPFLKLVFNEKIKTNLFFQTIIPQPLFLLLGFVVCAYNFDMWNSTLIQLTFFSSLIISSISVKLYSNENKMFLYTVIFILFSTQIIFLIFPNNYDRLSENKEFKEFFISLCFLVYSIDVYIKTKVKVI